MRQKSLSYIGPSFWNKLPSSVKQNIKYETLNTFKYDVEKLLASFFPFLFPQV